jgi:hypothetical protein
MFICVFRRYRAMRVIPPARGSTRELRLLRACRERPRNRAADQRDELASFQCPMPPVLPTERIAHLGCQIGVDS